EAEINPSYRELAEHYGTCIIAARVKKPRDKGKVEAAVLVAQRWILAVLRHRRFYHLEACWHRRWLASRNDAYSMRPTALRLAGRSLRHFLGRRCWRHGDVARDGSSAATL